MKKYKVYIENKLACIEQKTEFLGDIEAKNNKDAIEQAREKFNSGIFGFYSVCGHESVIFAVKN